MSRSQKLSIVMGGFADPISKQLRAQGIHIPGHATASLERSSQAIVQLAAVGLITSRARDSLRLKFLKTVARTIKDYTGSTYAPTDAMKARRASLP